jgi:hypothetical protein
VVYVRRRRPAKGEPPAFHLHGRRDCPALLTVADTQLDHHEATTGAVIDAYADHAQERGQHTTTYALCSCLVTATRLPTCPPLHARITVDRNPTDY